MDYSFNLSKPWISIDPLQGFLDASDSVAVTVSIDRTGLSNSTYAEKIQINAFDKSDKLDLYVNRVMDMDTNFYRVVEIGDQIWMAENLNVGTPKTINPPYSHPIDIPVEERLIYSNGIIEKYCYENLLINCDTYGGLYHWMETMQWWEPNEVSPTGPTQGICPDGWHIPAVSDWETLEQYYGGDTLIAYELTDGTIHCINPDPTPNESGFNAIFGGYMDLNDGWTDMDLATLFWTDSKPFDEPGFIQMFVIGCPTFFPNSSFHSELEYQWEINALSVRCIKDP